MTPYERWSLIIAALQAIALIPTLGFGAYQLFLQRHQLQEQKGVLEYEVYQRITQANSALLWRSTDMWQDERERFLPDFVRWLEGEMSERDVASGSASA